MDAAMAKGAEDAVPTEFAMIAADIWLGLSCWPVLACAGR